MNSRVCLIGIVVCLQVIAACGRPPEAGLPTGPTTQTTTRESDTTTTSASASDVVPGGVPGATGPTSRASTTQPTGTAHGGTHPRTVPTVTPPTRKSPTRKPPPPRRPARWVLSDIDRARTEEQTGISFSQDTIDLHWKGICPKGNVCIRTAVAIHPEIGFPEEDCFIGSNVVPRPLYEGGTVTWWINNPCGEDPPSAPAGP